MECNSFSKYAGFTGVRLGWTVVPSGLKFSDGTPVRNDFNRVMTTAFNGASNIVQAGGLACLDKEGMKEIDTLIDYYLENAKLLKDAMESIGYKVFGGTELTNARADAAKTDPSMKSSNGGLDYAVDTAYDPEFDPLGLGPRWEVPWGATTLIATLVAVEASFYLAGAIAPAIVYSGARNPDEVSLFYFSYGQLN